MLLGDNLLPLLVLAFGGAMAVGTALALVRPPAAPTDDDERPGRPPLARSLAMISLGALAAVWALASLVAA